MFKFLVALWMIFISCYVSADGEEAKKTSIEALNCSWCLEGDFQKGKSEPKRPQWIRLLADGVRQVRYQPEPLNLEFMKQISIVSDLQIVIDDSTSMKLAAFKASFKQDEPATQHYVVENDHGTLFFIGFVRSEFLKAGRDCVSTEILSQLK